MSEIKRSEDAYIGRFGFFIEEKVFKVVHAWI